MRARLVGAAVAALLAGQAAAATPSACKFEKLAELPVKFDGNRPLITVQLNGKPETFLLDTGAVTSALWSDAAPRLGLHPVQAVGYAFQGIGGAVKAQRVSVRDLGIGLFHARDFSLFALETHLAEGTVGVIGQDALYRLDVEFDLAAGFVRLYRSQDCRNVSLAYWTETPGVAAIDRGGSEIGQYETTVRLNGRVTVRAILDSGAPVSLVTPGAAMSAGMKPETLTYKPGESVGGIGRGRAPVTTVTFDKVEIADEAVSHAKMRVADMFRDNKAIEIGSRVPTHTYDVPAMILGADFLRSHHVLISSSQNRMYFTYKGGTIFQVVGPAGVGAGSDSAARPAEAGGAAREAQHP